MSKELKELIKYSEERLKELLEKEKDLKTMIEQHRLKLDQLSRNHIALIGAIDENQHNIATMKHRAKKNSKD